MLPSRVFRRAAALAAACLGFLSAICPADEVVRIMAANISSGTNQAYEAPGNRILQGLDPDIALLQEMEVGSKSAAEYRAWVNANFGTTFSYYVESGKNIPNGIVSRYPILSSGSWDDPELSDREFAWAKIDIPGDKNLLAVSVHLKASSGSDNETRRNTEASALVSFINANLTPGDHVVIGGDCNTYSRTEPCINTLSAVVKTTAPWPADQAGNSNTNSGQSSPYDWVMPNNSLATYATPLVIGSNTHTNGLVFDSRDYTPLSAVSPVQSGDSGVTGMQHMAVMRAFLIPTNDPPVIAQGDAVSVTLSKNNTPTAFSRSLSATDSENNTLTWSIQTQAGHGTAGIQAPVTGGTVNLSYSPATNYTGSDSFVVRVSDGQGGTDSITVNLTIQEPPNTAPVITQGTSVPVTLSKNNTPTAFSRTLNATDANGDSLTWTIATPAAHGTAGIVAPATGGTVNLSYTPSTNYTGSDSFVVQVSDGRGGTDSITVNLTIQEPPNTAPVIAQGTSVPVTLTENGTPQSFNLNLTATDGEGDTLSWSIATPAQHGTAGIVDPATGTGIALSYQPAEDYTGSDSFVVQVSDGRGGVDTIMVNLTIEPAPNLPPVIGGAETRVLSISQNGYPAPFQLALQAADEDSDPLTWSVSLPAGHGTASVGPSPNGSSAAIFYQPALGFTGEDSFTVQVSDGQGGSDTVLVQVTVESSSAFDAWTYATFAPLTPETELAVWGEDADPDSDGYSNLEEFAHGLNPQLSDAAPNLVQLAFASSGEQRQLTLTLKLRMNGSSPALDYALQSTADPAKGWDTLLPEDYTLLGETDLGGGFIARTIRLTPAADDTARCFRMTFSAPD